MTLSFFSLICPVYKTAGYLRECLASVQQQLFRDYECLCIDDGSPDESGALLEQYALADKRFIVIHKANAGVSMARNSALDLMQGEYVAFFDSDDYVCKEWLANIHAGIQAHPGIDWVRTHYRDWHVSDKPEDAPAWPAGHRLNDNCGYFAVAGEVGFQKLAIVALTTINIYSQRLIHGTRFPIGIRVGEDFIYSNCLLKHIVSLLVIKDDSYRYRIRCDSAAHNVLHINDFKNVLLKLPEVWRNISITPKYATYWIRKFYMHHTPFLDSVSWGNGLLCARLTRVFQKNGWLDISFLPTKFERTKWKIFLSTGIFHVFKLPHPANLPRWLLRLIKNAIQSCIPCTL